MHSKIHHVVFQTPTDEGQEVMRKAVRSKGLSPTQQIERHWSRSVYFRGFNGVLFELATNGPGYTSDELLEDRREQIEAGMTDVTIPRAEPVVASE